MAVLDNQRPLKSLADAFTDLAAIVNSQTLDVIEVAPFCRACSFVSPLLLCLGFAFKFADIEYVSKVDDLAEASKSIVTLPDLLARDVEANCVAIEGSHSRNLLLVKRGIDLVKVLFEQLLAAEVVDNSLKDPLSTAYEKVFAPYHAWAIRKAVAAGMYTLPTKAQLLKMLNEDEASARIQMQNYVVASAPVIRYIENLFLSRGLGIDG
ncbi:hypothetical protein L1049_005206 [Liquidambar formosana]|uniref:Glycolipid transfer protein domain-containing protein n=1 Tax=Liquidambar formosana TaxID=63359 RepID=A0AAP0WXH5_LIQFO